MFDKNDRLVVPARYQTFLPHDVLDSRRMGLYKLLEAIRERFPYIMPLATRQWQWTEDGWYVEYSFREPPQL